MSLRDEIVGLLDSSHHFPTVNRAQGILALVRTALLSEASVEAFDKAMEGKMANIQYVRPALAAAIDEVKK